MTTTTVAKILSAAGVANLGKDAPLETVETALEELAKKMVGEFLPRRVMIREGAIKAVRKAGIRSPAKIVDAFLERESAAPIEQSEPPPDEEELRRIGRPVLEAEDPFNLIRARAAQARYAGSTVALELLVLILLSRVLKRPINALLKALSAAGKSYTIEAALRFHPPEAAHLMTGSSERALIYSEDSFEHRYLVVQEAAAMQVDGIGASVMRELAWGGTLRIPS